MEEELSEQAKLLDHQLRIVTARRGHEAPLLNWVMEQQDASGCWKGREALWADILTARAIELLVSWGVSTHARWVIGEAADDASSLRGMALGFDFLVRSFERDHGTWGADWFDHAQVLRVVANLGPKLPAELSSLIGPAAASLRRGFQQRFEGCVEFPHTSEWAGPATIAAACMAFGVLDERRLADDCSQMLEDAQHEENGGFDGVDPASQLHAFHTANSVLALKAVVHPSSSQVLEDALNFLRRCRNEEDGSWGPGASAADRADFTAYVGRAFCACSRGLPEVKEIVKWLKQHQRDGSIGPLASTLHAGMLFHESLTEPVTVPVDLGTTFAIRSFLFQSVSMLDDRLADAVQQEKSLGTELATVDARRVSLEAELLESQKTLQKYVVRLTVTQVAISIAVVSLLVTIVGVILTIVLGG